MNVKFSVKFCYNLILVGFWLILSCFSSGCEIFTPEGTDEVSSPKELQPGIVKPQLRVGVKVRIAVSASGESVIEETLKEVSAQGEIVMPYVEVVQCLGLTIEEFKAKLTEAYKEFYKEPTVTAYYVPITEGGSSPWGTVLVMGAVGRPGQINIPQTCDLTVTRAIQEAGGLGIYSNSKVRLTRTVSQEKRQRLTIDTEKIGRQGRTDLDVVLLPGDVIYVPESNW